MHTLLHCLHCDAALSRFPERQAGELVIRCLECGSLNLIGVTVQVLGFIR